MKKFISLLLCFAMLLGVTTAAYADSGEAYSAEYEILQGLRMIPGNISYAPDKNITRGEFAQIVAAVLGYKDASEDKSYFVDLEKEYYASGAISYLYELNMISGYDDVTFRAGETITYGEAVRILLSAMGFGEYTGLYKNSYFPRKKQLADNAKLTQERALWYIYEAMNTPYCRLEFNDRGKIKYEETDDTVLERWSSISKASGVVTTVGYASLFDNGSESAFRIGDTELKTNNPEKFDCLGYWCEVYYYNDDADAESEVIYAYKDARKNDAVVISAQELSYRNGKLYYDDGTRNRGISIETNSYFVKNAKPISATSISELFNIGDGIITVNRIASEDIDVVLIEEYENYLVDSISTKNVSFSTKDGALIELDEDGQNIVIDTDGKNISFDKISKGVLASVMQSDPSLGNRVTKIVLSKELVSGTLKGYSDNEAAVDSEVYKVAKNISVQLDEFYGRYMTFYINFMGKIGYAEIETVSEFAYGYLCSIREDEDNDDSMLQIRIFGQDGAFHDYPTSNKIKIDNETFKDVDTVSDALKRGTGTTEIYQPIRYKLKDGLVRELDTAYMNKEKGENKYSLQRIFSSYNSSHEKITTGHLSDGMIVDENSFENFISFDSQTLSFVVPPEYEKDIDYYKVEKSIPEEYLWADAYSADSDKINAELIIRYSGSMLTPSTTYLGVIEKVTRGLNSDDEVVTKLTMTGRTHSKQEFEINSKYSLKGIKSYIGEIFSEYVPRIGDAIQYSLNDKGEIVNIVPYYLPEQDKWCDDSEYVSGNTYWGTNDTSELKLVTRDRFHLGRLYKKYGSQLQIALGQDDIDFTKPNSLELRSMEIVSGVKILKYNEQKKLETISEADLRTYAMAGDMCDKIIAMTYYNGLTMIVVYEG